MTLTHDLNRSLQAGAIDCIQQELFTVEYISISWGRSKWRATAKEKARQEDDLQVLYGEEEEECRRVGLMGGRR